MRIGNLKILLQLVGVTLVVVSILAFNSVLAGIGIGIAGILIFGPDVEDKRGKTAGVVYSKNRSGPFTRERTKPRNPQSNAQQANRSLHKRLMQAWKLQEVDHKAFMSYAEQHLVSNKMGRKIRLSGINWFVRINRFAMKANPGCALITTPPVDNYELPMVKNITLTATTNPENLTINIVKDGSYTAGIKLQVFATRQLSAGIYSANNFVEIGVYEPSDTLDITDKYIARWGELIAGRKVFVKARFITDKGDRGMPHPVNTIISNV
jgi:hypothetical protein